MENVPFDQLKVGDIVTYRHPSLGIPVVHRLVLKEQDKFWAEDANEHMDNVYVTPARLSPAGLRDDLFGE